ncbi:hypothetical protein KVT40_007285 [Elsinoe batatas]|uniref:Uncharacterized protein n=1 Tax=Elsinoe batatas TaxID=2601811 RepID=A0A8K0KX24_9PEZI|nr:hypothetical protein KVT40_007285 [Elsinoe batatas]
MASSTSTVPSTITNCHDDIAQMTTGEKMRVEEAGRQPYQILHVIGNGEGRWGKTAYDPLIASTRIRRGSVLPTAAELQGNDSSVKGILIGLIIADQPEKYSTRGVGQSHGALVKLRAEREARGILDRASSILPVVYPVTAEIDKTRKLFAVTNVTSAGIQAVIQDAVAPDSVDQGGPDTITDDDDTLTTQSEPAAHDGSITPATRKAGSAISALYDVVVTNPTQSSISAMRQILERVMPDAHFASTTSDDGLSNFFDFKRPLTL